ncbi:hypothetical protein L202_02946 [Cryptococcus amylolentus CBS 6039]|uniref:Right handed beta helix domain-containing protein n=1 Tax=Cryptococcus amylolentus CBS 6039 TaxID=1295533 RepID=A0A1E3HYF0_9TREE|nr:hypothetical protein L202_02946 [Cryptococcus amylolentus CBS 6039]ODN80796.1 hypothetical protein L202_02946 [Cryptococcus amylolentus CBS 6039]
MIPSTVAQQGDLPRILSKRKRRRAHTCSSSSTPQESQENAWKSAPTSGSMPHPLFFALLLSLLAIVSAAQPCVRFADYDSINQLFIDGGPGAKVLLCPNRLYRLSGPIVFTAADQELATYGYPTGSERAVLRVEGRDSATAIQGDCRRCARVSVKNVVVDGNRKKLGRMKDVGLATGLVVLGGNEGQSVQESWIKHPRGFTAIHIREGDKLQCTGAVIEKNEIGPVGEEFDPEKDGDDPEMSPLGRPLADGVSIACRDSFVRDNTFYDNTDAAVVVYCSPGTLIHANHIFARGLSAMAGILLVDSTPFDGDYSGVVVKSNIIDAASRTIRVGIGIGPTVWSDDTETVLTGGSVIGNGLKGRYMGYGIAAAGLKKWTVKDNWDEAKHEGSKSARCFDEPVNPDPMGLLYNAPTIEDSTFQIGFADHDFQYLVCIDGIYDKSNPPKHDLPPLPHDLGSPSENERDAKDQVDDSTEELEAGTEEAETAGGHMFATGSDMMDDILEHSHQRMMEAIDHLNRRVDVLGSKVQSEGGEPGSAAALDPKMSSHLEKLQRRMEHLQFTQKAHAEAANQLRTAIQSWDTETASVMDWQYDILLDVRHKLELSIQPADQAFDIDALKEASLRAGGIPEDHSVHQVDDHSHPGIEGESLRRLSHRARYGVDGGDEWTLLGVVKLILVSASVLAVGWAARRWRKRSTHGKLL